MYGLSEPWTMDVSVTARYASTSPMSLAGPGSDEGVNKKKCRSKGSRCDFTVLIKLLLGCNAGRQVLNGTCANGQA